MREPGHKKAEGVLVVAAPYMGKVMAEFVPGARGRSYIAVGGYVNSLGNFFKILRLHGGCLLVVGYNGEIALTACDDKIVVTHKRLLLGACEYKVMLESFASLCHI